MSPRIRERLYANIYDSVPLLDMRAGERFFGNRNIGNIMLTNLQVPGGQMAGDRTMLIANVYVRTNICRNPISEESKQVVRDAFLEGRDDIAIDLILKEHRFDRSDLVRAFDEWAHACVLELVIGYKPMLTMNVYDLLGEAAFGPTVRDPALGAQDATVPPPEHPPVQPWRRQLALPIIVPVRQNFSVTLSRAVPDKLVEELSRRRIEPSPLLWVHLEGLSTRDVQ